MTAHRQDGIRSRRPLSGRLRASCRGQWHSDPTFENHEGGYRDYDGPVPVPVIATTLARLQRPGPHGPVSRGY
ncbi:hypothetical protein [Streptomyces sp. RKAG290]|uniref:hypothetical protein n=1 Tax=Streptomyces sp. RKAG290 TaxID=2888348 RepID=UPI00203498C5|nr:hypothetical protein [Streptomyces sp. RKAG290]MCM2416440.1 hypothetical protein [Streptomyces sp. RKAG290]